MVVCLTGHIELPILVYSNRGGSQRKQTKILSRGSRDLRVSVSSSASPLASRFGSLSFSQLSFLAFWFCLLFFLPNQSIKLKSHSCSKAEGSLDSTGSYDEAAAPWRFWRRFDCIEADLWQSSLAQPSGPTGPSCYVHAI